MKWSFVSVLMALAGIPGVASAQTRADTMKVALATARWVQPKLSGASHVELAYGGKVSTVKRIEDARGIASALHAEPVLSSSAINCPTGPRSCTLGPYDMMVNISVQGIESQYAQAYVQLRRPTPHGKASVYTEGWWIQFVRSGSNWSFDRILTNVVQ